MYQGLRWHTALQSRIAYLDLYFLEVRRSWTAFAIFLSSKVYDLLDRKPFFHLFFDLFTSPLLLNLKSDHDMNVNIFLASFTRSKVEINMNKNKYSFFSFNYIKFNKVKNEFMIADWRIKPQ